MMNTASNHRTVFNIIGLYAAHTAPLYFATVAIPTILRAEGLSLSTIGLLGSIMLPWAVKFLWAPYIDRYYNPRRGKRKSWIIPCQWLIISLLLCLLLVNPSGHTALLFMLLFSLSLVAATQDIASAGYVIEQLPPQQRRWGNYAQVIGTTLGSASGGALALFCYGQWGWSIAVSSLVVLAFLLQWMLITSRESSHTALPTRQRPSLQHFWQRRNTRQLLYICLIYRACEGLVMGMQQPFLVDQQIAIDSIGLILGLGNATLGLAAAGCASWLLKPISGWRLLASLGSLRSLIYFALFSIAYYHLSSSELLFAVVLLNLAIRLMEMVVLYTLFMNHCASHQAATDFAILVCGELIIYMIGIALSGYLAEYLGYARLFLLGSVLSFPSVLISTALLRRLTPASPAPPAVIQTVAR